MIRKTFEQAVEMISGEGDSERNGTIAFEGVSTDTRTIQPGNLFIPLVGEQFDGHQYVADAIGKGASISLWQKDHPLPPAGIPLIYVDNTLEALQQLAAAYRRELKVRVIGITGSNGKTTTKDMVAAILATTYTVHKTKGNFNNHIGLPLTLLQMNEDTEMAVIEMGMSGRGEIDLLSALARPEAAIITNIGESHLLQLGSRKEIARAKLEILRGMKADGLLVYRGDEPLLEEALAELPPRPEMLRFRFGSDSSNDYYPLAVMLDTDGTHFTLNAKHSPNYYIPLLGRHNVINALAAIAVCKYMGVSELDIVRGLEELEATGMRIEIVKGNAGLTILNDAYNASPTSMKAALELVEELKGYGRKIAVLGDMLELGANEERFHREIGAILDPQKFDYVFTYGSLAKYIAEEALVKFAPSRVKTFESKEDLVQEAARIVSPKDLILVKGSRGMRLEEVVQKLKELSIG